MIFFHFQTRQPHYSLVLSQKRTSPIELAFRSEALRSKHRAPAPGLSKSAISQVVEPPFPLCYFCFVSGTYRFTFVACSVENVYVYSRAVGLGRCEMMRECHQHSTLGLRLRVVCDAEVRRFAEGSWEGGIWRGWIGLDWGTG